MTTATLSPAAKRLLALLDDIGGHVSISELAYHSDSTEAEIIETLAELHAEGLAAPTYWEARA